VKPTQYKNMTSTNDCRNKLQFAVKNDD